MILFGIVVGLLLGAIVGRSVGGLFEIRLRWISLIFLALALRIGTQVAIAGGVEFAADSGYPSTSAPSACSPSPAGSTAASRA